MRRALFTITATVTVALTGCSNSSSNPTTALRPTPASPCQTSSCRIVSKADINGDGSLDLVGLAFTPDQTSTPEFPEGTLTVRVSTPDGIQQTQVAKSSGPAPNNYYVGAFRISRRSGADLVFHTVEGLGNAEQFVVIGWTDGHLIQIPTPPDPQPVQRDPNIWYFNSSHGQHYWATCGSGAEVTLNKLRAAVEEGIPIPGGGLRESNHFAFQNGSWTPTGSENVADNTFSYTDFHPDTDTFQCDRQDHQ
ncbi:hypothetical protein FOS14_07325 [Skermania sp. ID1734]|uniref:hypothetical protein n=1 Tax=Skermania sp. ID1734 TaxID=2597516 RepID=UPI00117E8AC3|nr:hypothetical protein [Skermania sp. ID1734]TSE00807.1 hypothetical protein FOS14_07325 [Skermania sp. ID1734]